MGTKLTHVWHWSETAIFAPYIGTYADYYFTKDDGTTILQLPEFLYGWSARLIFGVSLSKIGGGRFFLGGELGGLGSGNFSVWSVRGHTAIPF